MSQHLSEEQFAELLAGEPGDQAAQAHLAACAACRQEVASIGLATASFNEFSLAWAQTEAPRRVPLPSRLSLLLGGRPLWGLGFATAMVAGALAFGFHTPASRTRPEPVAGMAAANDGNAELAADNRLMASIDQEIRYVPRPAVPLNQLLASTRHHAHHSSTSSTLSTGTAN